MLNEGFVSMVFVLSIGIDGGSWEIINEGIRRGVLPNIESIIKEGCRGALSSYPPITYPQWYVLLSGFNPGNIGVYGFVTVDKRRKSAWITRHEDFMADNVADHLTKLGARFALINVPGIVPRERDYNGYIVGDPFLPSPKYYPGSLKGVLSLVKYRNYDIKISKTGITTTPTEEVIRVAEGLIESRVRLASYLLRRDRKLKLLHVTIFVNDNIQHFYGVKSDVTLRVWRKIDTVVGRLLKIVSETRGDDYVVLLVSDHGFTDISNIYNIYYDLSRKGLVRFAGETVLARMARRMNITRETVVKIIEKPVIRSIAGLALRSQRLTSFALRLLPERRGEERDLVFSVDMEKSRVVFSGYGLYVLNGGERTLDDAKHILEDVRLPNGKPVFKEVLLRDQVVSGSHVDRAPDIFAIPRAGIHVSTKGLSSRFSKPTAGKDWVADHTTEAIIAAWSPRLSRSCTLSGSTVDYTPTLLSLLGKWGQGSMGLDGSPIRSLVDTLAV